MKRIPPPEKLSLVGEIIELYERHDSINAKVLLTAVCIDMPMDAAAGLRLGDIVLIETPVRVPGPHRRVSSPAVEIQHPHIDSTSQEQEA